MKIEYINNEKAISYSGRYYRCTGKSRDAVTQIESARAILARPNVVWDNGRRSHNSAQAVLERAELALLEHLMLVVTR